MYKNLEIDLDFFLKMLFWQMFQITKNFTTVPNSQNSSWIIYIMCPASHKEQLHPYLTFGQTTIFRRFKTYLFPFSQALWKHETGIVKGWNLLIANHLDQSIHQINHDRSGVKKRSKLVNSKPPEPINISDQSSLNVRLRNDFFAKFNILSKIVERRPILLALPW
jgi:hypothetical protein